MKWWRQGTLFVLLVAALSACGDPSGPRVPQPDKEEKPTDPTQTLTARS